MNRRHFYAAPPKINLNWSSLFSRYIYTDSLEFDGNSVLHVLYGARKYGLETLVTACETFLQTAIDVNNACSLFNQAAFYEMDALKVHEGESKKGYMYQAQSGCIKL